MILDWEEFALVKISANFRMSEPGLGGFCFGGTLGKFRILDANFFHQISNSELKSEKPNLCNTCPIELYKVNQPPINSGTTWFISDRIVSLNWRSQAS